MSDLADAQIQRSFLNLGFEQPPLDSANCWSIRVASDLDPSASGVPGWRTTEGPPNSTWNSASHGTCGGHPEQPPPAGAIQMFKNNFNGVTAVDGVQWAELNAFTAARLYQTVCLLEGDKVEWYLHHRGRASTDRMMFNIGPNPDGSGSTVILRAQTSTGGVGEIAPNPNNPSELDCMGTCEVTTVNGWAKYSGSFDWNQPSGEQTIGFQADGGGAVGNYLDAISLFGVSPIVELNTDMVEGLEGEHSAANFPISVLISGNIPPGETLDVEVAIVHVSTDSADVSIADKVIITVPAGDYAAQPFPIPLEILRDDIRENREQFYLEITDRPGKGGYRVGSVTVCGEVGRNAALYTILDAHASIEKAGTFVDVVGGSAADGTPIKNAGDRMDYVFTVTNTGDVTLTNLTVTDSIIGTAVLDPARSSLDSDGNLPPGGVAVFAASYTLTQADIDRGITENVANLTAIPAGFPDTVIEATSNHSELIPHIASIRLLKTGGFDPESDNGNGLPDPGERMRFDVTVTNDGNITAKNVQPRDPGPTFNGQPGTNTMTEFSPASADILPGQSQTFTAFYTLTVEDLAASAGVPDGIVNTASATAQTPNGGSLNASESVAITLPGFAVEKRAQVTQVQRGSSVPYTLIVKPLQLVQKTTMRVADLIPAGFVYLPGTATIDGVATEPAINGRRLEWVLEVEPEKNVEINLILGVPASAGFGTYINVARAERVDTDFVFPLMGRAEVEIIPDPLFDCGDIIGKVFDDRNRNGYQDAGETGVAGARVTSVNGIHVTTDSHGRFHVTCAELPDRRLGASYIMKLDPRSLPSGYRIISENPRVVRLTAGKMHEINFATTLARMVRLDIGSDAFQLGSTELAPPWETGIASLISTLASEPSVLRIVYRDTGGDPDLANRRLRQLRSMIAERWKEKPGRYRLEMEARVEVGAPALAERN